MISHLWKVDSCFFEETISYDIIGIGLHTACTVLSAENETDLYGLWCLRDHIEAVFGSSFESYQSSMRQQQDVDLVATAKLGDS